MHEIYTGTERQTDRQRQTETDRETETEKETGTERERAQADLASCWIERPVKHIA